VVLTDLLVVLTVLLAILGHLLVVLMVLLAILTVLMALLVVLTVLLVVLMVPLAVLMALRAVIMVLLAVLMVLQGQILTHIREDPPTGLPFKDLQTVYRGNRHTNTDRRMADLLLICHLNMEDTLSMIIEAIKILTEDSMVVMMADPMDLLQTMAVTNQMDLLLIIMLETATMVLGSVAEMAHDVGQMHYLVKEMNHSFTTQFMFTVLLCMLVNLAEA